MPRSLRISGFLLSMLLSACAMPSGVQNNEPASSAPSAPEAIEENVPETELPAETTQTSSGIVLPERLLSSGTVEIGNPNAPVTLLYFTEYHCQYCEEFETEVLPTVLTEFIEKGQVRLEVAILPLQKYAGSEKAATALLCGAMQEKGRATHMALFEEAGNLETSMDGVIRTAGLERESFLSCTESPEAKLILEQHRAWARSLHVTLVPTLFLNGEKQVGLPYEADIVGAIQEQLRK